METNTFRIHKGSGGGASPPEAEETLIKKNQTKWRLFPIFFFAFGKAP